MDSTAITVAEGGAGLRVLNLRKSYSKRPVIRDELAQLTLTATQQ